jgi:hypothetical protein
MHKILHTSQNRKIAYQYYKGKSNIGFIFFGGFCSDMTGNKAQYILQWCKKKNMSVLCLITQDMENLLKNLLIVQ